MREWNRDKRAVQMPSMPGILLMTVLLASCAASPRYDVLKFYAGPPLPKEQVSTLITAEKVRISRVNSSGGGLANAVSRPSLMELLPGRYIVEAGLENLGTRFRTYPSAPVKMEIEVKPGRVYEVRAMKPERGVWYPEVMDVTGIKSFEDAALANHEGQREGVAPSNAKTAFLESFDRNDRGWNVYESRDSDVYFSSGVYIVKTKSDQCAIEVIQIPFRLPENFDIELKSVWNAGLDNIPYGLVVGSGKNDSCRFHISKNGCAHSWAVINGKMDSRMDWTCGGAGVKSGEEIRQTVEARGNLFRYYVNGEPAGNVFLCPAGMEWKVIGVTVCGPQKVSFDELKIVTY